MDLSIVIVTYQSRQEIGPCLESIRRRKPMADFEVFVVDNASKDGTAEYVQQRAPWVTLIKNPNNDGFGRANNLAIKQARGRYVLALNPDTRVTEDALDRLLLVASELDKQKILGTLGPRLVFQDGGEQVSSYQLPSVWSELRKLWFAEKKDEKQARTRPLTRVGWSAGSALLFPRELEGELTLFDPGIFLYSEDTELCWRMRAKGRRSYVTALATIEHAFNKSGEQYFGPKAEGHEKRLRAYRDTTQYVMRKCLRGPLKELRVWSYSQLVALNSRWHIILIKLFGSRISDHPQTALEEHRARAHAFSTR